MLACSASSPGRFRGLASIAAHGVLIGMLAACAAGTAMARTRRVDSTLSIKTRSIDVGNAHIHSSSRGDLPMHLKGSLVINGKAVDVDDTIDVTIPRIRVTGRTGRHSGGPNIDLGPGIHVETDDESIVRMGSDIEIDSLEVVQDAVVALFGNVTVRGHVEGNVVAVLGSVTLAPGSVVDGDAVAVGGSLDQMGDAMVHGKSVSLSFLPIHRGMPPLRALAVAVFAMWLLGMLLAGLLVLMFPRRIVAVAHTVSERTGWSLLFGLLLPPLAVITAVLLIVTMIGIPVAVLLPLAYLFTLWAGTVAATYLMGSRVMRRPLGGGLAGPLSLGSAMMGVLFGFGALFAGQPGLLGALALFFPLLGLLLAMSLSVIGSGAVLVSRFGTIPAGSDASPIAPVVPAAVHAQVPAPPMS